MTSDKGRQVSLRKKRPAGRGEEGEVERGTEEGGGQVSKQTAEKQLESGVMVYLRRVSSQQDITPIIKVTPQFFMGTKTTFVILQTCMTTRTMKL